MTVGIVSIIWSLAACWKLALASLGLVAIFCFSSYSIRRVTRTWTVKRQMNLDSIIVHFSTTLEGIRTVKLLGKESYFLFHLDELQKRHLELAFHQMVYFGLSLGVTKGFVVFTQGLLLVYGLYLVAIGQAAAPNVVLVFTLILFCMQNCSQLLSSIPSVGSALTALLEVLWLTKLPLQQNECSEGWTPSRGEIEIRNVKFGYGESHKLIFNNLSLSTDDCEVLSLTGSSGCGKSTLWKLLTRLYEPLEGTITIDGRDITTIPIDDIRAAVSVVNQMPIKFFEGSIYDNLSFALSGTPISKESKMVQIRRAARACGLDEVISRLPTGYDTLISDPNHGQGKLSGGEIQRLGIARALLSNPKILILDEVTSALDTGSANALKNFIKACKISRNIKIIIITHDVEFASVADKTIIM
jgi:ABC-type multidrug transport system fused ATPase/permease subunit